MPYFIQSKYVSHLFLSLIAFQFNACKIKQSDSITFISNIKDTNIIHAVNPTWTIQVEPNEYLHSVKSSTIFKIENIIYLPVRNNNFISTINRLFVKGNLFYIFDQPRNSIYCFDTTTNEFIWNYSDIGSGPNQVNEIYDVQLLSDDKNNNILIWDGIMHKIVYLDANTGKVENVSKRIDLYAEKFAPFSKDSILYYNSGFTTSELISTKLLLVDVNNQSIIKRYFPYKNNEELAKLLIATNLTYQYQSKSYTFNFPFDDQIYSINNKNEMEAFRIDFGSKSYRADKINFFLEKPDLMKKLFDPLLAGHISNLIVLDSNIFLSYVYNHSRINFLYNKQANKVIKFKGLHDDLFGGLVNLSNVFPSPNKDKMYVVADSENIQNTFITFKQNPEFRPTIEKKFKELYLNLAKQFENKISNPIIFEISIL